MSVWKGRVVSESTLDSRINAARKAIGDSGGTQTLIRTVPRKGVRFVGDVRRGHEPAEVGTIRPAIADNQKISFCRSDDGVNIAYATVGAGPVLVKAANWLNHLEYDWDSPIWSPMLRRLASHARLIRYDSRANGLSDKTVDDISFAAFVRDFDAVVNASAAQRFAILGMSQGASIAIAHAVRYPEQVSKLILHGAYAQGRNKRKTVEEHEKAETFLAMLRHGWGDPHSAFMRAFASLFIPNGSPEQIRWFAELQRVTTTAENAARIRTACDDIDVLDLLPKVTIPTMVMHCRYDNVVPLEQGRLIAATIPNARFVTLESENHVPLQGEPAFDSFLNEIESFLAL